MSKSADTQAIELADILPHYGHSLASSQCESLAGGLINLTYKVSAPGRQTIVLQRQHPIFAAEVNCDIEAITDHLAAAGMVTPRLVRTVDGQHSVAERGHTWRAISYVDGISHHKIATLEQARSAGALVAQVHNALADLQHRFQFARNGVHDTSAHLAKLRRALANADGDDPAAIAGGEVLAMAKDLPELGRVPQRVCHGDLKISNILFQRTAPDRALCLIDLDTFGHQIIAYELGDAMRSWCNTAGEDDPSSQLDATILAAALDGFGNAVPGLLSAAEAASVVPGLETVCIELAARFCVDAIEDSYFGWDSSRYASRREHNLARTRGQLALARSIASRRDELAQLAISRLVPP